MPNYNQTHAFYAGVDLHARSMFTHVVDQGGRTVFERDLPASLEAFLGAVEPFRQGLVVGCEWSTPAQRRRLSRVELAVLPGRLVGTERFLRRRPQRATVSSPFGARGPDLVKLFGAAR